MDHYHIWVNLKDTSKDLQFVEDVHKYLGHLTSKGLIRDFHVTRRKLGFGPASLGEFHVEIVVEDMAQLEAAFQAVATRAGVVESFHSHVYSAVTDFAAALYRDYPDAVRVPPTGRTGK